MIGRDGTADRDFGPAGETVRGWVRLYTRGLAAEPRDRRRAEIDADLWDETRESVLVSAGGFRLARISRLIAGLPADIQWRIEHRGPARPEGSSSVFTSRQDIIWSALGILIGAVFIWAGWIAWAASDWETGNRFGPVVSFFGGVSIMASMLVVVRPVMGGRFIVASAIGTTVGAILAMPWAWFLAPILTIPLGYIGARRPRATSAG